MEKSNQQWHEETGHATQAMLAKYIDDLRFRFTTSPVCAGIVAAMRKTLTESGVNDDNIRTEEFSGY